MAIVGVAPLLIVLLTLMWSFVFHHRSLARLPVHVVSLLTLLAPLGMIIAMIGGGVFLASSWRR